MSWLLLDGLRKSLLSHQPLTKRFCLVHGNVSMHAAYRCDSIQDSRKLLFYRSHVITAVLFNLMCTLS